MSQRPKRPPKKEKEPIEWTIYLVELAHYLEEKYRSPQEYLDEAVREIFARKAAHINCQSFEQQIQFLQTEKWKPDAIERLLQGKDP